VTAYGSEPHGVPAQDHELPVTGDAVVDEAIALLARVDLGRPPEEHLPVLTAVHDALQRRLSSAVE
jgi:hypothetical protein